MDQQTIENSTKKNNFDLDEFDLEFKPINKGLGFHHNERRKVVPKKSVVAKSLNNTKTSITPENNKTFVKNNTAIRPKELEIFYSNTKSQSVSINKDQFNIKKRPVLESAGIVSIFFAWLVDLALIFISMIGTASLLVISSGISFKMMSQIVGISELTAFMSVLFFIYYLLYFAVLDLSVTPGKAILGIRLVKNNGRVRFKDTLLRSLLSLFSIPLFGLPLILKVSDKVTNTKIVK